jgi:hypothetical protein
LYVMILGIKKTLEMEGVDLAGPRDRIIAVPIRSARATLRLEACGQIE